MDCFKIFNIIGISLQILGVLILAKSDALARKIDAVYESIPGNPLIDIYEASKDGNVRVVSEEEQNYNALGVNAGARKALGIFKTSLLLVVLGMVMQLFVEIFKP